MGADAYAYLVAGVAFGTAVRKCPQVHEETVYDRKTGVASKEKVAVNAWRLGDVEVSLDDYTEALQDEGFRLAKLAPERGFARDDTLATFTTVSGTGEDPDVLGVQLAKTTRILESAKPVDADVFAVDAALRRVNALLIRLGVPRPQARLWLVPHVSV